MTTTAPCVFDPRTPVRLTVAAPGPFLQVWAYPGGDEAQLPALLAELPADEALVLAGELDAAARATIRTLALGDRSDDPG
jgi:hypothetical protein